jgi:ABC-type phosphate/phosphonate transport system substrate-binding protein
MCASLGMYDAPWLRDANDRLWAVVRDALRRSLADVPAALDRGRDLRTIWRDPKLLLAQTCGYPLLTELEGAVRLVATPHYAWPGCDGPLYCSFVVVRAGARYAALADLRGARCAINGTDSQSGMNALRALVAPLAEGGRFFGSVIETGGHLRSLDAVRDGSADLAAIDCVTHGLTARHRPEQLAGTRVLMRTATAPGLPFITAAGVGEAEIAALRTALAASIAAGAGEALGLVGMSVLTLRDYAPIAAMEAGAAAAGYPVLA